MKKIALVVLSFLAPFAVAEYSEEDVKKLKQKGLSVVSYNCFNANCTVSCVVDGKDEQLKRQNPSGTIHNIKAETGTGFTVISFRYTNSSETTILSHDKYKMCTIKGGYKN